MRWQIVIHPEVREWLHQQRADEKTAHAIGDALELVCTEGPGVGRPLVDTIKNSKLPNLKELRPGSASATEIRILFAFDPTRRILLLVAGDKSGQWNRWYTKAIPLAEARYDEMIKEVTT